MQTNRCEVKLLVIPILVLIGERVLQSISSLDIDEGASCSAVEVSTPQTDTVVEP
jgi:hypothetical protein